MASIAVDETLPRTQRLKKRVLDAPYAICIERARYVTQVYRRTEGMHPSARAAEAFENTLRNMSLFILDEERLAGNYCSRIVGTLLPVERGEMNLILDMDLDNLINRPKQPYDISPEDKDELVRDILPYWRGKTLRDIKARNFRRHGLVIMRSQNPIAQYNLIRAFGARQLYDTAMQFIRGRARHILRAAAEIPMNNPNMVNNVFDVQGHLVIGHNRIIGLGFQGIREQAAEKLKAPLPEDKKIFLESVMRCCDAAQMFAGRFAELARCKAGHAANPLRREELLAIAAHADRVPWLPPQSFHEALQFLWFAQVMALISAGMAGICAIGRPDQYLLPYLLKDLEQGVIDETTALELVEELLVKLSNNIIMLPSYAKDTGSEMGADSMAPTIGGVGTDGEDATNALSFMFLDAIRNLRGMSNSYSVRISSKTSREFFEKLAETHCATSGIAIFNDEAIVPALEKSGCAPEDARDYAVIGCVEPTPQGSTFGCTSGNDVSLVGALEMTFTQGTVRMTGRRAGPRTPKPETIASFDDFMNAFKQQLSYSVDLIARCVNAKDDAYMNNLHNPYISCTLEGCVDNAEDMTQGGAKYNFSSIGGRGLGAAADALSAVKTFVFDEKKFTMKQITRALAANFRKNESMRVFLSTHTPRYGADNPVADEIARSIAAMFCDEVMKHKSIRKDGLFRPGFFSYGMHVYDGSMLSATPDGRPAGAPVSNSLSPTNGAEILGPTATMRSAARIDHSRIPNGCSLNMKLLPVLLETQEGRRKFETLIRGYFKLGGQHVQFNVVDNKTLRDAQEHPDKYRDLLVRVSGYAAYFTDLGKPVQDDIIRRTEFAGF